MDNKELVDVGIVIALKEEFEEIQSQFGKNWQPQQDSITGDFDYLFDYSIKNSSDFYRCVATLIGQMGSTASSQATKRLIDKWKPKTMVLMGISAGLKDDVKIGDVVVADQVCGYLENSKAVGDDKDFDFQVGSQWKRSSSYFIQLSNNFRSLHEQTVQNWQKSCSTRLNQLLSQKQRKQLISQGLIRQEVLFRTGEVASGQTVGAAEAFTKFLRRINRNFLALEMESYGFLSAIHSKLEEHRETNLILRGISDYGDERKTQLDNIEDGALRRYAMHNAIKLLQCFLQIGAFPHYERPSPLASHFKEVTKSLLNGKLVFFIGSGVNLSKKSEAKLPPSDIDIVNYLARDSAWKFNQLIGLPCAVCPYKLQERPKVSTDDQHSLVLCPVREEVNQDKDKKPQLWNEQELAIAKAELRCRAEYLMIENNYEALARKLRRLFKNKYEPNQIQELLANLAVGMQQAKKCHYPYQLIVTTNYDVGWEGAFVKAKEKAEIDLIKAKEKAEIDLIKAKEKTEIDLIKEQLAQRDKQQAQLQELEEFEVVYYIADGNERGQFKSQFKSNEVRSVKPIDNDSNLALSDPMDNPDTGLPILLRPIILKLYGGALYENSQIKEDSFAIAQTHHINYLKSCMGQLEPSQVLPDKLLSLLEDSDILFIGYSANDTDLYRILNHFCQKRHYISDRQQGSPQAWLIHQSNPGELNREELWEEEWGVTLVECGWEDYIAQLRDYLEEENLLAEYSNN